MPRALVLAVSGAVALALGAGSGACTWSAAPGDRTTSILLISVDTLRADRLNCYGYQRRPTSPNIDALAADGILAETHIAAAPWTTPSHLSMLTSLPPTRHGVTETFAAIRRGLKGWDSFEKLPDARLTLAEALKAQGRVTAAFTGGVTLNPELGFGQGFDSYDVSMIKLGPAPMRDMTRWIGEHRKKPFFLFWHTFEVHAPYTDTRFLRGLLPPDQEQHLRRALGRLARRTRNARTGTLAMDGAKVLRKHGAYRSDICNALYDGGVRSFDAWLGELVRILKAARLYDSMMIVLTSDHGEALGDHGAGIYNSHGGSLYGELLRVPLIIKLPQKRYAGRRVAGVTSALDLMPTILDCVGATPAKNEMEGSSLRPIWERSGATSDHAATSEALNNVDSEQKSLRIAGTKLIVTIDEEQLERHGRVLLPSTPVGRQLFDLSQDPRETTDLLAQAAVPAIRTRADDMERALRQHLGRPGEADVTSLDETSVDRLRALGYLD